MQKVKFVRWKEEDAWLGYLQDYPDYWTQGKTLKDLKDHLKDLYKDLTGGKIPGVRKVEELVIS
jgi:predicted RNase H-like HicB family nuclease